MDAWNPDQLKRMQLGGNDKLNNFLAQYGVSKTVDIRDKYNSKAAEFYRDKIRYGELQPACAVRAAGLAAEILPYCYFLMQHAAALPGLTPPPPAARLCRAEVEGRPYSPPPPSAATSFTRPKSFVASPSQGRGGADWDDWGDSRSAAMPHSKSTSAISSQGGGSSEYTMAQLQASAADKEDFFARKMAENASRPDHLPPSQGGCGCCACRKGAGGGARLVVHSWRPGLQQGGERWRKAALWERSMACTMSQCRQVGAQRAHTSEERVWCVQAASTWALAQRRAPSHRAPTPMWMM